MAREPTILDLSATKEWLCHWLRGATIKSHEQFPCTTRNDGTNGPCKVSQMAVKLFVGCPQMCRCCSTLWDHDFLPRNIHRTWPMSVTTGNSSCNINLYFYWNTILQLLLHLQCCLKECWVRVYTCGIIWVYGGICHQMLILCKDSGYPQLPPAKGLSIHVLHIFLAVGFQRDAQECQRNKT